MNVIRDSQYPSGWFLIYTRGSIKKSPLSYDYRVLTDVLYVNFRFSHRAVISLREFRYSNHLNLKC
jgi:hypothetical protein